MMEALARSVCFTNFPEAYPFLNSSPSCLRTSNKRIGSLKISDNSHVVTLRCQALSRESSQSGEGEDGKPLDNGFGLVSEDVVEPLPQVIALAVRMYF